MHLSWKYFCRILLSVKRLVEKLYFITVGNFKCNWKSAGGNSNDQIQLKLCDDQFERDLEI